MSRAHVRCGERSKVGRFVSYVHGVIVCAHETQIWDDANKQETSDGQGH
jgi:hypothetical protein